MGHSRSRLGRVAASQEEPPGPPQSSQHQQADGMGSEIARFCTIVVGDQRDSFPKVENDLITVMQTFNILDTVPEEAFTAIANSLKDIYKVPIVSVNLVDSSRQWFKCTTGLPETRGICLSKHLQLSKCNDILLLPNATLDARFQKHGNVTGEPFVRFYCEAPVMLDGERLGSLCIVDQMPRQDIGEDDAILLTKFADMIAGLISKGWIQAEQYEMLNNPSFLIDVSEDKWPILYMNPLAKALIGGTADLATHFLDDFSVGEVIGGCMLSETRVQDAVFRCQKPCSCIFLPASQDSWSWDSHCRINTPGSEVHRWPMAARTTKHNGRIYNFVVVKWDTDDASLPLSQWPLHVPTALAMPSDLVLQSKDDLAAALEEPLCVFLFTSRLSVACTYFAPQFHAMAKYFSERIKFYVVNVDDKQDIRRQCCTDAATILPSVEFYVHGGRVDRLCGVFCTLLEEKLEEFLVGQSLSNVVSISSDKVLDGFMSLANSGINQPETEELRLSQFPMVIDGMSRLRDAERAHSRQVEALLSGSIATKMRELRAGHEAALAKIAVLQKDLSSRRSASRTVKRISGIAEEEYWRTERVQCQSSRQYLFKGTVSNFLGPVLMDRCTLIYGGPRADCLQEDMQKMGIAVKRQPWRAYELPIPTQGRRGKPLAIVDVIDNRLPDDTVQWFEKVSDALSQGSVFATISANFDLLDLVAFLGESYGWGVSQRNGANQDYGIIALEKGAECDELLSTWGVERVVENQEGNDGSITFCERQAGYAEADSEKTR